MQVLSTVLPLLCSLVNFILWYKVSLCQYQPWHHQHCQKGAGKKGSFFSRNRSGCTGFLSYLGKWPRGAKSQPSPSEEPQEHCDEHGHWYYCNHTNPLCWPKSSCIQQHFKSSFKCPLKFTKKIYFGRILGRILIANIIFSCTLHCIKKDVLTPNKTDDILAKFHLTSNDKNTNEHHCEEARCTIGAISAWGGCVPCHMLLPNYPLQL